MNKVSIGSVASLLAVPVMVAGFAAAGWAQSGSTAASNSATLICRPAILDEAANAKMIAAATSLVCRPFAVSMRMSDGSMKTIGNVSAKPLAGPDFSRALTTQQVNAAYNRWLESSLDIDPLTAHSP